MKYLKAELEKILKEHKKWLNNEDGGCRANLRRANLRRANLRGADLCGADLRDADLRDANLCGANMCGADLRDADLCDADLCDADLCDADLCGADLCGANLCGADLCGANLDFSMLYFSCKSLHAKFSQRSIIQILYHAAMPTQNNYIKLDDEIKSLFESDKFKRVVNKFHRVKECDEFTGPKKEDE